MTVSHTPGPWACTYTSNHAHDYRITRANGLKLPLVVIANDHSEQRANARLIGAAPEMFTLCEQALRALEEEDFPQLRQALRDVLEKVETPT